MEEYKSALKNAVDDWAYVENLLKEKLWEERVKNERLEKEKEAIVSQKGKSEIVDDIKQTYDQELKLKDEELNQRDTKIDDLEFRVEELETHLKAAGIDMADTNTSVSPGLRQKMQVVGAGAAASQGLFGPEGRTIDARALQEQPFVKDL